MHAKLGNAALNIASVTQPGVLDGEVLRESRDSLLQFCFWEMYRGENHARRFFVAGRVQGVGYRNFVQQLAEELGLRGYVRNRRDGRVEVLAIGSPEALSHLRQALEKGPMMSRVAEVIEEPAAPDTRYEGSFTVEMTI